MGRALDILRKQGRLIEKPEVETLEALDQLVLAAVYLHRGNANIVSIASRVRKTSQEAGLPPPTALCLCRLADRVLVLPWPDEPDDHVEAKTRTKENSTALVTVTLAAEHALGHARETSTALGDLLGDFA